MAWAILFRCISSAESCVDQPTVTVAVLRHWRSYWLPPIWECALVVLPVRESARGIVPIRKAAGMSYALDSRYSEQGAVGVCAIHCDSHRTGKYNINSSRFVLWSRQCNVRVLIAHMLPVTVHCNVYAFKVTVQAIPLQAWRDPEGSRSFRLPDFKTVGTWRW
jgi:hypothetical protein